MDERIFIGVGSNIEPERNIQQAGLLLQERVSLVAISTFYRTAPINRPEQGEFLNGVFEIRTELEPLPLKFDVLREIEKAAGRRRNEDAYAAREIDLDILLYGSRCIRERQLEIPDPDIRTRSFVAVPLLELAPDLILPDDGRLDEQELVTPRAELRADADFSQALKVRLGL